MAHHDNEQQVCVRKVTVEYAFKGQRFSIDFEPMRILAIVFSKIELDRINEKLRIEDKPPGREDYDATVALQDQPLKHKPGATSKHIGKDSSEEGPPLWWRTDASTWFHPQL